MPVPPGTRLPLALGLLLAGGLVLVGWALIGLLGSAPPDFRGTAYHDGTPAPDFRLVDHHGNPATLADHRGHAVLLFFGFTHCPDVCPTTLARISRALAEVRGAEASVRVLLVTVDPARDTPDVLARYAARFPAPVVGLTGEEDALADARSAYGVYLAAAGEEGGSGHRHADGPVHSSVVYGIDREGVLRVVIPAGAPEGEIAHDVRLLLRL